MLKPFRDETMDDPQPSQIVKKSSLCNTGPMHQQQREKGLAPVEEENVKLEKMPNNRDATQVQEDHKGRIWS